MSNKYSVCIRYLKQNNILSYFMENLDAAFYGDLIWCEEHKYETSTNPIGSGFKWRKTKQGYDFWNRHYMNLNKRIRIKEWNKITNNSLDI